MEAHFTPIELGEEIPFSITSAKDETDFFLYTETLSFQVRYRLRKNENDVFVLDGPNPFRETEEIVNERLLGLSLEWIENKTQGFESSYDFTPTKMPGYGPDDIFVENKPFSLRQIVDLIESNDIELTPDFQRNFIWDQTRQSKLIESILLGLPLPSIYLSQYPDGRLTVVDGLQRLMTIKRFMNNEFALTNPEYLVECKNKRFKELEGVLSSLRLRRFGQTQIMCFVLDYRSPSQLKFDLFRRLNTGGKPLNNQEIRNCLSRPYIQSILKEMVSSNNFGLATNYSVKDTRMDAREAALRFIYFYEQFKVHSTIGRYNGDMEYTLDSFTDELNFRPDGSLDQYLEKYDQALGNAYYLFGDYCFRKVLPKNVNGRKSPVNKLLMLVLSVLLADYDKKVIYEFNSQKSLLFPLAKFIENEPRLFDALTWGTNAKWNLEKAFTSLNIFLEENII